MMRRANMRIKGNVQMAGFRTFIKNIADSVNVKVFAENLDDGSVKVICEGEEEGINELINSINSKAERLVSILGGMDVTLKSVKEDTSSIKEDTSSIKEDTKLIPGIKENTNMMLEKQGDTISEIRNVSEKIDEGKEEIVTEISSLRGDLRSYMENKFDQKCFAAIRFVENLC